MAPMPFTNYHDSPASGSRCMSAAVRRRLSQGLCTHEVSTGRASEKTAELPMPSVFANSITKLRKPTNPSSQQPSSLPALSYCALTAASTSNFVSDLRRSKRTRRPSAHKRESDEYEASSRGSSRPPSPSGQKGNSQPKDDSRGERGNRPGRIKQPDHGTRATSYCGSPEPSPTPGLQRGDLGLAGPGSPGDALGSIGTAEAIRRATAFLGSDASNLPARALRQVLDTISGKAKETQESPLGLEGVSAPAVLQPTRGMVLGSGHKPPTTGTTDATSLPQKPKPAGTKGQLPLDGWSGELPPNNEDTTTEDESEPENFELGPGDSVSQRLPAPPPLHATTIPPRPSVPSISHALQGTDKAEHSNNVPMDLDVADVAEASATDSDTTHARKRPRLTAPSDPIHLSTPQLSHSMAPSTTPRPSHPASTHSMHPTVLHATPTTARIRNPALVVSPGSSAPPPTSDLSFALQWAARLADQLTCPDVTNTQGAGPSRQGQPEMAYDLVTQVLETLRSGLATTAPAPQANPRKRRQRLKHTEPIEDDAELIDAEAALELGQHVSSRRKPTLADFPGYPRRIASLAIPELIAVACTQGAYEVFGTICDWAGDTYNKVWARELGHLRLQKAPHALKGIMVHRMSWFRGETKVRVRPVVPSAYPFVNPPRTRKDLIHNRELAEKLLPNAFHCLDPNKPHEHQYEHPALRDCIATAFFWAPDAIGPVYHQKFRPVPLPAVAMVLTIMQHTIKEWKTGRHVTRELNVGKQLKVYDSHLKGLLEYMKPAGRRLQKFQLDWFKYGLEYAGTLVEDDDPYQLITEADHVRPDTPMSDSGSGE